MTSTDSSIPSRPGLIAYAMLAIAIGALIYGGLGFIGLREAQIPTDWQQTQGQILETRIEILSAEVSETGKESFRPRVRFAYEVDGTRIESSQLSRHHPVRTLRGVAETEIEDLSIGDTVTVHYDPKKPTEAVLRKSDTIGPIQAISVGLMIGLTCLALFVISFRRSGPRKTQPLK